MIDSEMRELLGAMLPAPRPAPPDLRQSVLAAGRRAHRRRRLRRLAGAVALVAVLGVAPLLVAVGRGPAPEPAASSVTSFPPSMTPTPSAAPSPADPRARFGSVVQQTVRAMLPTATFTALQYMEGVRTSEPFEGVADAYGRYAAGADFSDGDRDGYLAVRFDPADDNAPTCDGGPASCVERTGPHGEKIIFWTYVKLGVTTLTVEMVATGVGTFRADCSNAAVSRLDTAPPPTDPPLLTGDQVIEVLVALESIFTR
jgi:hypothetical protein